MLISCHTAMAQRRSCDMEVFCASPSGKVPNGSQLKLSFGYINRGPDIMYSDDTTLVWLFMVVDGKEIPVYNSSITGRPGGITNVGDRSTYAVGNSYIPFSFPDATDTLLVDFCVVIGSGGVSQNGDTVRPFSYDDPNWNNNKICNQIMVLPQRSTTVGNIEEENNSLLIYPNPATNVLYINTQLTAQQVIITDITGRIMLEKRFNQTQLNNNILSLNTEQLPTGIYNVTIKSNENTIVKKLIITR